MRSPFPLRSHHRAEEIGRFPVKKHGGRADAGPPQRDACAHLRFDRRDPSETVVASAFAVGDERPRPLRLPFVAGASSPEGVSLCWLLGHDWNADEPWWPGLLGFI